MAAVSASDGVGGAGVPTGGLNLSGPLPMDAVSGVMWTATYGICAVGAAWTAPNKNLFTLTTSGVTIKTVKGGYPDIKAFAAALGIDPYTGVGGDTISGWFDQSSNEGDAIQTTAANRPWVGLIYGRICLGFGGVLSSDIDHPTMKAQFLNLPPSVVMNTQSCSIFSLVKPYSTTARTASSVTNFFGAGRLNTIVSNTGFALEAPNSFFADDAGSLASVFDLSNFESVQVFPPTVGIQNQVSYAILSAAAAKYGWNEYSETGPAITAASPAGGNIGSYPASGGIGDNGFCGRGYAVLISSTVFSPAQEAAMKASLYRILNMPTSPLIANVLIDGASLDQGQGGVPGTLYTDELVGGGMGWPEFLMDDLSSYPINWNNVAGSGFRIDQGTDFYNSIGNRKLFNPALAKNILIGPNSQYGNSGFQGRTIAQIKTDFTAYMAAAQADPWYKIATAIFPEADDGTDPDGVEYNRWVLAGAAAGGYEVLQGPFDFFNDPSNLSGDHISVLGYRRMATAFMPQLRQWLGI
ncbi:hypothetical protein [Bradyrhizobium sp. 192]|uniref:hypothetical protein n=1 Tax=Bradyrhizobium sp. 192 TaxID=2782660 RepID=UPI001FFE8CD8|nr:hypothetical protein [Bradyrhizobium sp. 192]UPJ55423.1 hypothetical protein IVB24_22460 [Bradyrhizobium sp. 192]